MNITKVNIFKLTDEARHKYGMKCLGIAEVIFDCDFIVKDIKIMTGKKGEYLVFPTDKTGNSLAFPVSDEYRKYMLDRILTYLEEVNNE